MATSNSTVIRWKFPDVRPGKFNRGFSLMEVMIGVFLSSLLISGIVQLLGGSASTYRLQLSQGQLEESARYARDILISHISQAGYQPEPWQALQRLPALTDESLDGESMPGDQLGLQRWSMRNCYGNENPITGSDGRAAFYLLQAHFHVNSSKNLAMTCRYGADASALVTQISNYGLVENVESMQVLYAEDRDGDKIADTWVTGQAWQQESNIRSIKIGLLLSTPQAYKPSVSEQITLLDTSISTPADGHLRKLAMLFTVMPDLFNRADPAWLIRLGRSDSAESVDCEPAGIRACKTVRIECLVLGRKLAALPGWNSPSKLQPGLFCSETPCRRKLAGQPRIHGFILVGKPRSRGRYRSAKRGPNLKPVGLKHQRTVLDH